MFKTTVGPVESDSVTYLRPETAQGMFVNFKNIIDSFHPRLPFGIAQIGRSFRNEINARDFLFRAREFEIMEFEYFIQEEEWEKHRNEWLPSAEDKDYVRSCMVPVYEPGKFANWIAPPSRGVNEQPLDFEYVKFH